MPFILAPSMMSADYDALGAETELLDRSGADMFHIDIMDGAFVPNLAMGVQDVACIRRHTKKPVDAHLMMLAPSRHIALFAGLGVDILYIHPETEQNPCRTLGEIAERGVAPGIAVNPGVSFETVRELLPLCRYVLCMGVNPGFGGQLFLPHTLPKIERFAEHAKPCGYTLLVDGGVCPGVAKQLRRRGVDGLVLGRSALFGLGQPYDALIAGYRTDAV